MTFIYNYGNITLTIHLREIVVVKFNTFNSAQETSSINLKKRVGAAVAAAAVGLTGAACGTGDGGVRQYSKTSSSESLPTGEECLNHPDNVATSAEMNPTGDPLNGISTDHILERLAPSFFRDDVKLYGYGDTEVTFTDQQIEDIQNGVDTIKQQNERFGVDEDFKYMHPYQWKIGVLNKDGVGRLTDDGHIDGRICVDGGEFVN